MGRAGRRGAAGRDGAFCCRRAAGSERRHWRGEQKGVPPMNTEALLLPLSYLCDEADSRRAAAQLLDAAEPDGEIERLYPALLEHNIFPAALAHLERAGGDLERLTVSTARFRATWPYNALLPTPDETSPGRISLASIRRRLETHRTLLHRTLHDLIDAGEPG